MARLPVAPTQSAVKLRGDYAHAAADFRLAQNYDGYTADEQAIWRTLYERQLGTAWASTRRRSSWPACDC